MLYYVQQKGGVKKMIHVGVGHSQSLSTAEAAERATLMAMGSAGIAKADLAIVFATINYQTEYERIITKRCAMLPPVVMSSSGVVE